VESSAADLEETSIALIAPSQPAAKVLIADHRQCSSESLVLGDGIWSTCRILSKVP
jgi:hypothetical protein